MDRDAAPVASWFLAQVKPNSHAIAERNLSRQGFEIFLPMQEQTSRIRGRFVSRIRPLFPGYVFVLMEMAKGHSRVVNSTLGLTRLVSFGGRPQPVPDGLVQHLRARCDDAGCFQTGRQLQPGDQVAVTSGPFAEFVAKVETLSPDQRVWLLLDFMGNQTRISLNADQLRAV